MSFVEAHFTLESIVTFFVHSNHDHLHRYLICIKNNNFDKFPTRELFELSPTLRKRKDDEHNTYIKYIHYLATHVT